MRIVHALHAFPPYSRAGSENYVEALALEQQRRHRVVVFHRVAEEGAPEYETTEASVDGLPVVRLNRTFCDMKSFEETYRNDSVAGAFGAFLDREKPDVVHFHHVTCLSTSCVDEARRRGIPVVFTLHDFWLLCPRGQRVRRDLSLCERHTDVDCVNCMAPQLRIRGGHARLRQLSKRALRLSRLPLPRALFRRIAARPFNDEADALTEIEARNHEIGSMCDAVDRFISPSQFLKDQFVEAGASADKISVIDNGFDPKHWRGVERVPNETGRLRVAYLGTWIPTKGIHVLVEAFRDLDPEHTSLEIHGYAVPFDGVDDYEAELRSLAGDSPHIRFGSAYRPEEVPGLLAAVDVLVVPSTWYENSPLTVHEAFLAGVPVVASDHGGLREYVRHGENGLTFRPGDSRSLRESLQQLIDDPALLARLSRGASPVQSIAEHAELLDEVYAALPEYA